MTRLIVNADDFGLTSGVNRAILELHRSGVLTSATMMARAAATEEAISIARSSPTLGVGCHIVLVDGEPVLPPSSLPTLTHPATGRFHPTLGKFVKALLTRPILAGEIESEACAQIQSLQARGVHLTHIDTHKHTHMFPQVLRPVLRAARSCGVRLIRNPFEPSWSANATSSAPRLRRMQVHLLRLLETRFRRIVAQEECTTTDGALGVLATGTLDAPTLASLLHAVPEASRTFELVTHPGYNDAALAEARTRLLASRDQERAALLTLRHTPPAIQLISFRDV